MQHIKYILRGWLPMAFVITAMCGLVYLATQQTLRLGANDPQIQLAEDAAEHLSGGGTVESILPARQIDLAKSIAPFIIVFDEAGKPLASSALLNGEIPNLPAGVFDYVRQNGEDRITWQPEAGVRMAIVVVRVSGTNPGFVLAGRSLREVEIRENQVYQEAGAAWIISLLGSLVAVILCEFFLSKDKSG